MHIFPFIQYAIFTFFLLADLLNIAFMLFPSDTVTVHTNSDIAGSQVCTVWLYPGAAVWRH